MTTVLAAIALLATGQPPREYLTIGSISVPIIEARVQGKSISQFKGGSARTIEVDALPYTTQIPRLCEFHYSGRQAAGRLVAQGSSGLMALEWLKAEIVEVSFPKLESRSSQPLGLRLKLSVGNASLSDKVGSIPKEIAHGGNCGDCYAAMSIGGKRCPFPISVAPFTLGSSSGATLKVTGGDWASYFQGLIYTEGSYKARSVELAIGGAATLELRDVKIQVKGRTATFASKLGSVAKG